MRTKMTVSRMATVFGSSLFLALAVGTHAHAAGDTAPLLLAQASGSTATGTADGTKGTMGAAGMQRPGGTYGQEQRQRESQTHTPNAPAGAAGQPMKGQTGTDTSSSGSGAGAGTGTDRTGGESDTTTGRHGNGPAAPNGGTGTDVPRATGGAAGGSGTSGSGGMGGSAR